MQLPNNLLRFHGSFLLMLGITMTIQTIRGYCVGIGMLAFLHNEPLRSVGLFEAYLLAGFTGAILITLSGVHYTRKWHLFGAIIHAILFTTNILFWEAYALADIVKIGYISTTAHVIFILLEGGAYLVLTLKHHKHGNATE